MTATVDTSTPIIAARDLWVGYSGVPVVRGITITVRAGEIVALLGPNGAGKTTTMLALSGELAPMSGTVEWRGRVTHAPVHRRAVEGMAVTTTEREVVMSLTALDNLRLGRGSVSLALEVFPELADHLHRRAGLLSGGQQQMIVVGRALASKPSLLLADELSFGLAPLLVQRILTILRRAADSGVGILLVEQFAHQALAVADRAYVMRRGSVVIEGSAREVLSAIDSVQGTYLAGEDYAD